MIHWPDHRPPGETLLWQGEPLPGIRNKSRLVLLALFGIPFLLIGIFGTIAALQHIITNGEIGFGLFILAIAILLGALGATLVFWQWVHAARAHRTIRYGLTTRAAYIAHLGPKQRVDSYPILASSPTSLERRKGYDNLWFHLQHDRDSDGSPTTTKIGFEGIADGEAPYKLIRSIQAGLT